MITHIVAMNKQGAIGKGNQLPWHIPEDLKRFQELTKDQIVLVGSKTFLSIEGYRKEGKPFLPGRQVIVLTSTIDSAVALSEKYDDPSIYRDVIFWTKEEVDDFLVTHDIMVIGGTQVYALYPPEKVLATLVDLDLPDADAFYPYSLEGFHINEETKYLDGKIPFSFVTLEVSKNDVPN